MGTATDGVSFPRLCATKHFIPLWGQQPSTSSRSSQALLKHFIPLWGQQHLCAAESMSNHKKHFIPLWGQQRCHILLDHHAPKHFIPLWGQQPLSAQAVRLFLEETFHTPSGTKRKPICPIGHTGFYFIRSCYSHITPPIPSAVLMPTPAYGAKCSSRFAIVR